MYYLLVIFYYAVKRGYLAVSPMRLWKTIRAMRRDIELTLEDTKRIMDNAPPHVHWAMEVDSNPGVRPGPCELFSLKREDADFDKKRVHVYSAKDKYASACADFRQLYCPFEKYAGNQHVGVSWHMKGSP